MSTESKIAIYVAIIGATATIIAATISTCNKNNQSLNPKTQKIEVIDSANSVIPITTLSKDENKTEEIINQNENNFGFNLDAKKAWEEINNSPPFQKDQISKNYQGLKINWNVTLESLNMLKENQANVMSLYKGNYPWIYFKVDITKYPILKTAKKGTPFIVSGTILEFKLGGFEIALEKLIN